MSKLSKTPVWVYLFNMFDFLAPKRNFYPYDGTCTVSEAFQVFFPRVQV